MDQEKTSNMNKTISITQRETQILNLIAFEFTINEIANRLFISHHTVVTHRKNLMSKLKVKNTAGMIRRAFELHLLHHSSDQAA